MYEVKRFSSFLSEDADTKVSSDTAGKLHELLTGYHLNGGRHMQKHPDKHSESPKQVHDRLKASISKEQYDHIHNKAKSAADDIRKKVEQNGHKIHGVDWTSKPGDLHRTTGIHATQREDPSDIVVTTKNNNSHIHHGISLKVSDTNNKHVPVGNPGIDSTLGGKEILEKHREELKKKHPKINASPAVRRAHMKSDEKLRESVRKKNTETLRKIAAHTATQLNKMHKAHLANHIRKHVLAAKKTPMQHHGHTHMRHTTYMQKGSIKHHSYDPSTHHEPLLQDHKNLSVKHDADKPGSTRILFQHKGKTFAAQKIKFNSQSDPLSAVKSSTTTVGDH